MGIRLSLLALLCVSSMTSVVRAEGLRVLGAGSLREVMAEIGERYKEVTDTTVTAEDPASSSASSRSVDGRVRGML